MEPFGEERADLRAGIIASAVCNSATHGRGGFKPSDFMPTFGEPKRQSVEEMQALLMTASRQGAAAKPPAQPTATKKPRNRTK
jgi:hypothetical protein